MLSMLCSQEGSKTEHLAASPLKAHVTATGEASCKPVLWSRVLPQARGGPWRVGWPRDLGEGRGKSPEAGSRPCKSLCLFGFSFPSGKHGFEIKFACALSISGMVGIRNKETIWLEGNLACYLVSKGLSLVGDSYRIMIINIHTDTEKLSTEST